jgi:predicted O-methyltransferase YrrM
VSDERWDAVDRYVQELLIGRDEALERAIADSAAAGLPAIALTPALGKLLHLIARVHGARSVLEIGTLGGYSTIWLARALPDDGRLVTLELNPDYARVAAANVNRAGLAGLISIKVGRAIDSMRELAQERVGPFDLVFIDADKETTPEYFELALQLTRVGGVILTDNVVRGGEIADPESEDPRVRGMQRFHELVAREPRVSATTVQTVGAKGYDGFTLALVER